MVSLIVLLFFFFAVPVVPRGPSPSPPSPSALNNNEFVLHPDKVDSFYYRAAMSALLKVSFPFSLFPIPFSAKFKTLLSESNSADKIIYSECLREAQTLIQKAKCLVGLMDIRKAERSSPTTANGEQNEDNPLRVLLNAFLKTDWSFLSKGGKPPEPPKQTSAFGGTFRRKRSTASQRSVSDEFAHLPPSIRNLRRIERYLRKADYVQSYADKLNAENARQLGSFNIPTQFRQRPPNPMSAFETLRDFLKKSPIQKISILSPRLLSLFPSKRSSAVPRLFSPDVFSFHDEGAFALPGFFKMVFSDEREIHEWLDLLLRLSGASKQLDQILGSLRGEMKQIEERLYPKIRQLEEQDSRWREFEKQQTEKQRAEMSASGYTFLEPDQASLLFDQFPQHIHYNSEQKEHLLEEKIRQLAQLDENLLKHRKKRQIVGSETLTGALDSHRPPYIPQSHKTPNLYPQPSATVYGSNNPNGYQNPTYSNYGFVDIDRPLGPPRYPLPKYGLSSSTPGPSLHQFGPFPTARPPLGYPRPFPQNWIPQKPSNFPNYPNNFPQPFPSAFTTPPPPFGTTPTLGFFATTPFPFRHSTGFPPFVHSTSAFGFQNPTTPSAPSNPFAPSKTLPTLPPLFPPMASTTLNPLFPPMASLTPNPLFPPMASTTPNPLFPPMPSTTVNPLFPPMPSTTLNPLFPSKTLPTLPTPPPLFTFPTPPPPPTTTLPPGVTPPPDFKTLKAMLGLPDDLGESPDAEHGEAKVVTLQPWAFEHRIGGFVILEGIVLSPHAVTSELFSPELLTFHVLTPRAFLATVLSPMALFARILSPSAFRAEVLSPQALTAYVLTPEAFMTEVLSPKILEVRVLSPKAFTLQVLSPSVGSPKVQSPENLGIVVLSPSILSPHIMSDGCLNVEILSPHLLSGGHDEHDHLHGEHGEHGEGGGEGCCGEQHEDHCCGDQNQPLPVHSSHSHFNQFVPSNSQKTETKKLPETKMVATQTKTQRISTPMIEHSLVHTGPMNVPVPISPQPHQPNGYVVSPPIVMPPNAAIVMPPHSSPQSTMRTNSLPTTVMRATLNARPQRYPVR